MSAPVPESQPPLLTLTPGIARLSLRRPRHRNRLHNEDLACLLDCFERIEQDPTIRVLVLDAVVLPERPVFSAGYHTGEFEKTSKRAMP